VWEAVDAPFVAPIEDKVHRVYVSVSIKNADPYSAQLKSLTAFVAPMAGLDDGLENACSWSGKKGLL
jgi:hypothetical protein